MSHIYNDEDNEPMEDPWLKYTTYSCKAEYEADMRGELDRQDEPDNGCWNCLLYDPSREACTKEWNNLDEIYYIPARDDHDPTYYCSDHETDPDAVWEDWFGEEN